MPLEGLLREQFHLLRTVFNYSVPANFSWLSLKSYFVSYRGGLECGGPFVMCVCVPTPVHAHTPEQAFNCVLLLFSTLLEVRLLPDMQAGCFSEAHS